MLNINTALEQKLAKEQATLQAYRSSATSLTKTTNMNDLSAFIAKYRNNDPDNLIPSMEERLRFLDVEKNKENEDIKRDLASKQKARLVTIATFRSNVKIGDDSHCGLVIDVKKPLVKIQTIVGERWFKLEQVYPKDMANCQFYNGVYQDQ